MMTAMVVTGGSGVCGEGAQVVMRGPCLVMNSSGNRNKKNNVYIFY